MAYKTILFRGKPVIAVKPIEDTDFNTEFEFGDLVEKQDLDKIIVTEKAWSKYESFLHQVPDATYEMEK